MSTFWGIVSCEYRMGVRRWGVWLAFLLGASFYLFNLDQTVQSLSEEPSCLVAGRTALLLNFLLPVVGGIAISDRLERDARLGMSELLWSTPLSRTTYVLGKYVGALLPVLTAVLAILLIGTGVVLASGAPMQVVGPSLLAFLAINVPAYVFIGAYSLACPVVLPLRAYQVLFTGYWFWANFASPDFVPTVNGTVLEPLGEFAASAFFGTRWYGMNDHTTVEAVINLAVLATFAALALLVLERYIDRQHRQA